jgi:glutamate synthase (NADPH/NADH) small chain
MDALRTAIRCGARQAVGIYRRDEAGLAADAEEYANAVEEGAEFFFLSQPIAVMGDPSGAVSAVQCVKMERGELDGSGRFAVSPVPGSRFDVPADVVLVAYGFKAPGLPRSAGFAEIVADDDGCVAVDERRMTNIPGVFACGSVVRGVAPLSEVVRDARDAALALDRSLK